MAFDEGYNERLRYWERMELSTRTINCLAVTGINNVEELLQYNNQELLRIPNFGKVSLRELRGWLDYNYKSKFEVALVNFTDEQLLHEIARRMRRP